MQCPICLEPFTNLDLLNGHLDEQHPLPGSSKAKPKTNIIIKNNGKENKEEGTTTPASTIAAPSLAVFGPLTTGPSIKKSNSSSALTLNIGSPVVTGKRLEKDKDAKNGASSNSGAASLRQSSSIPNIASSSKDEEKISKTHWKRETGADPCTVCGKNVNLIIGRHHCRKCGDFVCSSHSEVEMKLDLRARQDPVNGLWYRVCDNCFKQKDGYNDMNQMYFHTEVFVKRRKEFFENMKLESHRLANRLQKLLYIYEEKLQVGATVSHDDEESIVRWQDDSHSDHCPFCQEKFVFLLNRKHHCRLCGRLVCGGSESEKCSVLIPVAFKGMPVKSTKAADIRICRECNHVLKQNNVIQKFLIPSAEMDEKEKELDSCVRQLQEVYQKMAHLKSNVIEEKIAIYNDLLIRFRKSSRLDSKLAREYENAVALRKELMDALVMLDGLAKKVLKQLPVPSGTVQYQKMYKNIYIYISQFLQNHMFTLQMLPKVNSRTGQFLDQQTTNHAARIEDDRVSIASSNGSTKNFFTNLFSGGGAAGSASETVTETLEELQEQVKVFEEQKHHIEEMIHDAIVAKRLDDVKSLRKGLGDIELEIKRINKKMTGKQRAK